VNAPSHNATACISTFDTQAIRSYVELLHSRADGINGLFVVTVLYSYGGEGTVTHHKPGDVEGMVAAIAAHSEAPGANVYCGLHLMRSSLTRKSRGKESDIVAMLGLIADMDADTGKIGEMPVEPSFVIQTSTGNSQPAILFDAPVTPQKAKELANALSTATGGDSGTKDITHIWRVPGTLNYPGETKLKRGRSQEPVPVLMLQPFQGLLHSADALAEVLGPHVTAAKEIMPVSFAGKVETTQLLDRISGKARDLLTADVEKGGRSEHAASVIEQLGYEGFTLEETASLCIEHGGSWTEHYKREAALIGDVERIWAKLVVPKREAKAANAADAEAFLGKTANDNEPHAAEPKSRFNSTWFDDIENAMPKETIVKGVLGVNEFSLLSGLPASGKSVIATDAGCHVASDMEWFGRKVKQGLVVYIAAERKALTERRMLAFRKTHGVKDVPLLVLGGRIDLTSSVADAEAIVATIKAAEKECGYSCVWVIVDTLTRTFGPGDQNASKDMGRFIRACDVLMEKTGAHVTVIHHTAWSGERGKGAIDLDGAVDASFLVQKHSGSHVLLCDGANDGDEGPICRFNMKSVEVGTDEDGEPTFAPVVIPSDTVDAVDKLMAGLKGHNATVLQSLHTAIAIDGEAPPSGSPGFPEEVSAVSRDTWRARYYDDVPSIKNETARKRFRRALDSLVIDKHVNQVGEWFWPV
jgi:hypothetical protein